MNSQIPFQAIDWASVIKEQQEGKGGKATSQTLEFGRLRMRIVEYSPNYEADHWCQKGHVVHCLEGAFFIQLNTGEQVLINQGSSFVVSDDMSSHRSVSEYGAKLLIIDGDFLKAPEGN